MKPNSLLIHQCVGFVLLIQCLILGPNTYAQQNSITGRVTSGEDGTGIPGVSILIKGTTQGTATDVNGNYSVNVPSEDAVLVFSSIGYLQQEITIGRQSVINVVLVPDVTQLDEVVVVGYGTVNKSDLTGSVASVSSENFNKGINTNVEQALIGRAAGVEINETTGEPGGGMAIRIRGASSITAGNDPLFVIDGMPIDNTPTVNSGGGGGGIISNTNPKNPLNTLNPNNIESIEILKDASATAIYGARGANGVILITTKRGAEGQSIVSYNFSGSIQTPEKRFNVLSTQDYIKTMNEFAAEAGQSPVFSDADIAAIGDGVDYQDEIFRTAYSQTHNLSFSGGTKALRYHINGNYLNQEGLVINNELKRYGILANIDSDVSDRLQLAVRLNISQTNDQALVNGNSASEFGGVLNSTVYMDPTLPIRDADGRYYNSTDVLLSNPVAVANGIDNDIKTTRILGNTALNYKWTKELSSNLTLGYDQQNVRRDAFNSFVTYLGFVNGGEAFVESLDRSDNLAQFTTSYSKSFGSQDIQALIGTTYQSFVDRRHNSRISDFPTDVLGTSNLGLGDPSKAIISSNTTKYTLLSYFGRLNYNFKQFLLTATLRADGSSRFGENHRFGYFPSVALGWKVDEEKFVPDFFDQLKLRVTWGKTGNQEISNFTALSTYSSTGTAVIGNAQQLATGPSRLANPDLKWETTEQFNIGADLAIFDGRISASLDFFVKNTSDMLIYLPLPLSVGYSGQLRNVGSMINRGFEISLQSINIHRNSFKWQSTINIYTLHNEVTGIGGLDRIIMGSVPESTESATIIQKGLPLNSFYGYRITGIYQNADQIANSAQPNSKPGYPIYADVNEDGIISELDKVVLGNPFPDFSFGLRNTFTYKAFALDIFINGNVGNELYNGTAMAQAYPRTFRRNRNPDQIADRWTPSNPDAKWPSGRETSSYGPGSIVSLFAEDASYIRLRTVTLSYEIPTTKIHFIESASVNVTGGNLLTITNYTGLNPDANLHGSSNVQVDFTTYPLARSITLGLNVTF